MKTGKTPFLIMIILLACLAASCGKTEVAEPASEVEEQVPEAADPTPEAAEPTPEAAEPTPEEATPDDNGKDDKKPQTGDFDVSNPKWNWINWDTDGDGREEEILFEYIDQGDEAPSFILVTLYEDDSRQEVYIDRAYGLISITAEEDEDGPYLSVEFETGDYYGHGPGAQCIVRVHDGKLTVEQES